MRQPLHLAIVALVALKSTTWAESDASKEMKQKWFMENPDLAFDNEADTFTLSFTHGAGDGPADPSPPIIEIFRRCPHGRRAPFPESMEYFGSAQDDDIDFLTTIASPANPDYFVPVRGDELYQSTWTFQINANVKDDHYQQGQHAVFALLNEGTDMAAIRVHFCIRVGLQNAKHISLDGSPPPVMNFREIYLTMSARLIAGFSHSLQVERLPTDPPPVLRSQFDTQFQTRVIDVLDGGVQGTFHAQGFLCPGWDAHKPIPAGTMVCLEICPIALDSAFVYTTSIPYMELGSIYGSPEVLLVEGGGSSVSSAQQHSSYECTPADGCCTIRFIATGEPRWVQGLGAVTMDRWDYEQDNLDDHRTQQLGVVAGNITTHNETWPQRAVFRTEIFQIGPEEESSDTVSRVAIIVAVVSFGLLAAGGVYYSYIHHQLCCCVPVVAAAKKTSDSDDDSNPPSPNASRHSVVLTDEDTSSENSRHSIGVSSPC